MYFDAPLIVVFAAFLLIVTFVVCAIISIVDRRRSNCKKRSSSEYEKVKTYKITTKSAEGTVISGFFVKSDENDECDDPDLFFTDDHGKEHFLYINGSFITSVDEI